MLELSSLSLFLWSWGIETLPLSSWHFFPRETIQLSQNAHFTKAVIFLLSHGHQSSTFLLYLTWVVIFSTFLETFLLESLHTFGDLARGLDFDYRYSVLYSKYSSSCAVTFQPLVLNPFIIQIQCTLLFHIRACQLRLAALVLDLSCSLYNKTVT